MMTHVISSNYYQKLLSRGAKPCLRCKRTLPLEAFLINKRFGPHCVDCRSQPLRSIENITTASGEQCAFIVTHCRNCGTRLTDKECRTIFESGPFCGDCRMLEPKRICCDCGLFKTHAEFPGRSRRCRVCADARARIRSYKQSARMAVRVAIRNGTLLAPDTCPHCGRPGEMHAHHNNYDKPLDVDWYCNHCHNAHHFGSSKDLLKIA